MLIDGAYAGINFGVLLELQLPKFRVVHHERVAVRSSAQVEAPIVASREPGDTVEAEVEDKGWIRLQGEDEQWMLIDGTALNLGLLLESIAPARPITLRYRSPTDNESQLREIAATCDMTLKHVRNKISAAIGVSESALMVGRGESKLNEEWTIWKHGLRDKEELSVFIMNPRWP